VEDFEIMGWGVMSDNEKAAWLSKFILNKELEQQGSIIHVEGQPAVLDSNLIAACETSLPEDSLKLYVTNAMSETGALTYVGMSRSLRQTGEAASKYYKNLLMLPIENRALALYWTAKGEKV